MLAKQPRKTRPILLAAACIALVAAGAIAVAVLRGDDDKRPATTDSTPPQTQPTAPPMTQETAPSAPESTAVQDDTISAVDPTDALVEDLLLTPSEYYPGVPVVSNGSTDIGVVWDPVQAHQLPSCRSYVDSVFRPLSANDDYRLFLRDPPRAFARDYVSVLASEDQAISVMNALAEPAFLHCGADYFAAAGLRTIPEPLGFVAPSDPPFAAIGDQLNYYTWETSWPGVEELAYLSGTKVGAFTRVGRTITYVEGFYESPEVPTTVTPDQFRAILENVVARAEAVSSGIEYSPPVSDLDRPPAILLPANDYAPGWHSNQLETTTVGFDPEVAGSIPQCQQFKSSVFDLVASTPHGARMWRHNEPLSSMTGQYVLVLPDVDTARTLFATINEGGFGTCAASYNAAQSESGALLPSFFEQPSIESPSGAVGDDLAYRRYPQTWTAQDGHRLHDETVLDAAIRVDRVVVFVRTIASIDGEPIVSDDEFHDMLVRVVERANDALA